MQIKIISDSTCDLSQELLSRYDIDIIPLYVIKGGEEFRDGITIRPYDIFRHVSNGGNLCSTSAISIADCLDSFSKYSPNYDAVIMITIGSCFSSCYQNACVAAENFDNVYVVDSANLSTGQGHVVVSAARLAEQDLTITQILEQLNDIIPKVEASFLIEELEYMRKGGRCSAVAAFGANLLNLKPCIEVKNGKMGVAKKYKGSFKKCIKQYVKERLEGRDDIRDELLFVTHPDAQPEVVEEAKKESASYNMFKEIVETRAGCTVSCHCGPHTLGILFIRK